MTITLRHLVGTREDLSITIAALINSKWTVPSGTSKPTIEALGYIPSMDIDADNTTDPNIIKVSVIARNRHGDEEPNGDDSHMWSTDVQIDIWSESVSLLQQYEDEVNRILWENRPNENTRIKKSDGVEAVLAQGAQDSEIERFEDSEIGFEFLGTDSEDAGAGARVSSQGTLRCYWFKLKT